MPQINISNCRGVNATRAALQLEAGEPSLLQNIRSRPTQNWVKRKGIEATDAQASAVWFIGDFNFDSGEVVPLRQDGATLTFNSSLPSDSLPGGVTPPMDNWRIDDEPDGPGGDHGGGGGYVMYPIESVMRACADRFAKLGHSTPTWTSRQYNYSGTAYSPAQSPGSYPPDGFYAYDLYWRDIKESKPTGTYAASLVNEIRTALNSNALLNYYVNMASGVEGKTTVPYYSTSTSGLIPAAATASTYRSTLSSLRTTIRKLLYLKIDGTQTTLEKRSGTGTGGGSGGYKISGYTPSFFNGGSDSDATDGTGDTPWDGVYAGTAWPTGSSWEPDFTKRRLGVNGAGGYFRLSNTLTPPYAWIYDNGMGNWDCCVYYDKSPMYMSAMLWNGVGPVSTGSPEGTYTVDGGDLTRGTLEIVANPAGTCTQMKIDAANNMSSYSTTTDSIGMYELTNSTTATLAQQRGYVQFDFRNGARGRTYIYFLVDPKVDGKSNEIANITADSKYHLFTTTTATNNLYTTDIINDGSTPSFSGTQDCPAASLVYGWDLTTAVAIVQGSFTYNC